MRLKVRRLDSHFIEALGVKGLSLIVEPHFCGVNKMLWNCSCVEGLTKISRQSPSEWQNSAILSIEHFASSLTHGVKCENLPSLSVCLKNHSVLGTIDWNEANYFFFTMRMTKMWYFGGSLSCSTILYSREIYCTYLMYQALWQVLVMGAEINKQKRFCDYLIIFGVKERKQCYKWIAAGHDQV